MTIAARFEIPHTRFLDPAGQVEAELPAFAREPEPLLELYRAMVLTRTFDAKAVALQRTGRLGTFASSLGQEAVAVGVGAAMDPKDVLLPFYRDAGAQFWRGTTMVELLAYWGGDPRGMDFQGPRQDFPVCIPIATQVTQATGVAYAFKLRQQPRVAVTTLGDGASSKGDFYEAINCAGVWQLPVVFVINNNQWAISVPLRAQTAAQTLAQKAIAAGIPGEQVDGNDVIAVRQVMDQAIKRARNGGGPTLVEALSYRLCDHTTADDASRYRSAEELEQARASEPVARLRTYLTAAHGWTPAQDEALQAECAAQVEAAVERYLAMPPLPATALFEHIYAELPKALEAQRAELTAGGERHG